MGCLGKFFLFIGLLAVVGVLVSQYFCCSNKYTLPDFTQDNYWGKKVIKASEAFPADNVKIRKFEIKFTQEQVDDLRDRLLLQTKSYLEPLEGSTFTYGFHPNQLKKVVNYWLNGYDLNKTVKELNALPQYLTQIEGIDVHFIHSKPAKPKYNQPLMLVHGWPGSVYEFYKLAHLLKNDFELVIPAIPGYGFSERPHKQGFGTGDAARIFVKLMKRLGHEKFFYHGGDWGAFIGQMMGVYFPENVEGVHLSLINAKFTICSMSKLVVGRFAPNMVYNSEKEAELGKQFCPAKIFFEIMEESGYMHIQATKPDTLGALLADSPAGMAAYILEKFSTWTNRDYINREDGGLTEKFTLDELLTNVAVYYWLSGNGPYSHRFYKENIPSIHKYMRYLPKIPKQVAFGYTAFPQELLARYPRFFANEGAENVAFYSIAEAGGHFAAFEEPQIMANTLREFANTVIEQQKAQQQAEAAKKQQEL